MGAGGDFAQAYVLAHEVGHHIQNLLGVSMAVQRRQRSVGKLESNQLSVRTELQADCYAGVWAHHAHKNNQRVHECGLKHLPTDHPSSVSSGCIAGLNPATLCNVIR